MMSNMKTGNWNSYLIDGKHLSIAFLHFLQLSQEIPKKKKNVNTLVKDFRNTKKGNMSKIWL